MVIIPTIVDAHELTLNAFVQGVWWARHAEVRLAPKTRDNYAAHYRLWVADDPLGATPISAITTEAITVWQDRCRAAGASDAVIAQAQKVIAGALRWAAARGTTFGLRANPMREAEWPSQARGREPYVFSPAVIEAVRRAILTRSSRDPRCDALLLSLMSLTGARPFTALAIRVADLGARNVRLGTTKSGHERRAPLWAPLRAEAEVLIAAERLPTDAFLIRRADGGRWTEHDFRNWRRRRYTPARNAVADALRAVDPALAARLRTATPYHLCRHSYIALCLQAGWPLARISRIVDNRVDTLARRYANVIDDYADAPLIDPEEEVERARAPASSISRLPSRPVRRC